MLEQIHQLQQQLAQAKISRDHYQHQWQLSTEREELLVAMLESQARDMERDRLHTALFVRRHQQN